MDSKRGSGATPALSTRQFVTERMIGQGTFGKVMLALDTDSGRRVAIKRVLQDPRFRNRELQIMRALHHPNVVPLLHHFCLPGEARPDEIYLHLVMEFVPETLVRCLRSFQQERLPMPAMLIKVFLFQLIKAMGYLHLERINVCHRDIKPHNVLVHEETGILKLCDFGSAKQLNASEPNVAYICSRYYRAPELIFGNQYYSTAVDVWSVGCIFAEMMHGEPIFRGENSAGQLTQIIRILGTPSTKQLETLRKDGPYNLPQIQGKSWADVLPTATPNAIDLLSKLLVYIPDDRIFPFDALCHPFFDELREADARLPSGQRIPTSLWEFSPHEREGMSAKQREQLLRGN